MPGLLGPGHGSPCETPPDSDSDRCLHCGRRHLAALSSEELASSARAWRGVEVAAAGLRLVTDRRQGRATPQWVHDLAAERPNAPLPAGWEEVERLRLAAAAREVCPCRCHGMPTEDEVREAALRHLEVERAAARLKATLDRRLGRSE